MFLKYFLISLILGLIQYTLSVPPPNLLKSNLMKVLTEYKKLETKIPKDELKTITTLGILNGAIEAEKNLEQHLTDSVADLILNLNINNTKETLPKIEKIEKMIERDRSAIQILSKTMDLARDSITNTEYRIEMKKTLKDFTKRQHINKNKYINNNLKDRLDNLKIDVLKHITTMQSTIKDKANATLVYLEGIIDSNSSKLTKRMDTIVPVYEDDDDQIGIISDMFADSSDQNLVQVENRQDDVEDYPKVVEDTKNDNKSANQEAQSESLESTESKDEEKPGGLAGLIANLSGGDEGSDIGALLGAITGVVSRLFGPNGLDIPSLISTGSSLVAGLLSGGRNFGTVLGEYVGLAFDGFSGGGGAINNGQFLGNLLGTIFAQLSSDPEDDDEPPKPELFIENFLNTFVEAKSKKGDKDDKDDKDHDDDDDKDKNKGSDSFGFIKHVVKAVVGGITSFLLNASLGSSSGSSKSSSHLFSGSSSSKGPVHGEYNKYHEKY